MTFDYSEFEEDDEFLDEPGIQPLNPEEYDQLIRTLLDDDQEVHISSIYQLSDLPDNVMQNFLQLWSSAEELRREVIARHMADICEQNFVVDFSPFVSPLLKDPSPKVRIAALDMLWDSTDTKIIPQMLETMREDRSIEVRATAAASLGHFVLMAQWGEINSAAETTIVKALLEQLSNPLTVIPIRRAALESISSSGAPQIPDLIDEAYRDVDPELNISAVFAMGRSGDSRWTAIIDNELDSDDAEMRAEAVRAAGSIGDSALTKKLAEIAKFDDDYEVQLAAVHALGQIGSDEASKALSDMSSDEDYESLHDVIEEALEEMMMLGLDLDLSLLDFNDDDEDDDDLYLDDD